MGSRRKTAPRDFYESRKNWIDGHDRAEGIWRSRFELCDRYLRDQRAGKGFRCVIDGYRRPQLVSYRADQPIRHRGTKAKVSAQIDNRGMAGRLGPDRTERRQRHRRNRNAWPGKWRSLAD